MTVRDFIITYKCYIILFLLVILLILGVFTSRQYILISKANRIAHNHLITKEGSRIPSTFAANKPDTAPTTIQDVLIFKNADVEPNSINYKINLFENHKMTHDNNVVQITRTDPEFLNDTENKVPIMFPIEEIQDGNSMVNSINNMVVMVPAGEAGNYKFMIGVIDKDMKFNTVYKFSANVDTNILIQFPTPINVTNQILFLGILKDNQKYVKISNIILNKENAVSVSNISVPNGSNGVQVGGSLSTEYKNDTPIYYKTIIDEKNTKMKFLNNENNDYFVELSRFDEEFMLDKSNKLPIVMIFDNLNLYKKENQTMNIDKPVNNIDNIYFKIPQSGKYKVMIGTVDNYGINVFYKYDFDIQSNKNMVLVKLPNPINIENKKLFMGILKEDSKTVQISQIVFNFNGEIVN